MPFTPPIRGISKKFKSEFRAWWDMKHRCYNRKNSRWSDYGGRGILVCHQWLDSFRNFLTDLGPKPNKDFSLDRIDNELGYFPENCRWANRETQQRNQRWTNKITYKGITKPLIDWCEELHLPLRMIQTRLRRKWSVDDAFTTPTWGRYKNAMTATINGKTQTLRKWAKELGFENIDMVYDRLALGWTIEKALLTPRRNYPKR